MGPGRSAAREPCLGDEAGAKFSAQTIGRGGLQAQAQLASCDPGMARRRSSARQPGAPRGFGLKFSSKAWEPQRLLLKFS